MIFTETKLKGVFVIELKRFEDERGFFAQTFSAKEFAEHGLNPPVAECNTSLNLRRGTMRGLHFQSPPYAQAKLVRCTAGAVYDCVIDLRPDSTTFKQWTAVELTAQNYLQLYVPEGFAHGFLTLADASEVFYQVSEVYAPHSAGGVRWNDPTFQIEWPIAVEVINERDASYADFQHDSKERHDTFAR
ncbi:MAG: dTDP-4-dehydrorhamnose 3,5-epimerase [Acidobacteriota bacterium]|jgi:dTDP-4-dehydrorhamnose 3,5-epimerase|nr:dTDP-4-dehydrorhamnose 3,5-epimerase [Acidobacteriota bacterium]